MPTNYPSEPSPALPLKVIGLGLVIVGGGHWLLGEKQRAIVLAATIYSLFFLGLIIGGLDVVDPKNDRLWFAGQMLIGPPAIVTGILSTQFKADITPRWNRQPQAISVKPSIGRPNEVGTLYSALAGMLNLLVIMDGLRRATVLQLDPEHAETINTPEYQP